MNKTFGSIIKDARNNRRMTQGQVCEEVNEELRLRGVIGSDLTQPTVSAWEGERQMPSGENVAVLQALEKVLKLKAVILKGLLKQTGKHGKRAPDDEYGDDVEEWLKSATASLSSSVENPRIWFLAPNTLPAFFDTTQRLFKLWVSNIRSGVHYKMLWILEGIKDPEAFSELGRMLDQLYEHIEDPKAHDLPDADGKKHASADEEGSSGRGNHRKVKGRMDIYLVNRPNDIVRPVDVDALTLSSNKREFERREKLWKDKGCSWISWHHLGQFDDLKSEDGKESDREVYEYLESIRSPLLGRLAVYLGAQSPQASMLIVGSSSRYGGESGRIYRWLGKSETNLLKGVTGMVEEWIKKKTQPPAVT